MTEFTANNNKSASIKLSLFFTIKSLHPCISFDIVKLSNINICEQIFKQKALDFLEIWKSPESLHEKP